MGKDLEESGRFNPAVARLTKLIFSFLLVLHLTACLYWTVANSECKGAFDTATEFNSMPNFCPHIADMTEVVSYSDLMRRYVEAFHFALMLIIGNTSFRQDNTATVFFTVVMLLVGIAVFSSIIGGASALLANLDSLKSAEKAQCDSINHYLAFRKVPTDLRRRVAAYVKYLWRSGLSGYH